MGEAVERDEGEWTILREEGRQAAGAREDGKAEEMDARSVSKVVSAEAPGDGFGEVSAAHARSGRAEIDDDAKVLPLLCHPKSLHSRPHLSPTAAHHFTSSLFYILRVQPCTIPFLTSPLQFTLQAPSQSCHTLSSDCNPLLLCVTKTPSADLVPPRESKYSHVQGSMRSCEASDTRVIQYGTVSETQYRAGLAGAGGTGCRSGTRRTATAAGRRARSQRTQYAAAAWWRRPWGQPPGGLRRKAGGKMPPAAWPLW